MTKIPLDRSNPEFQITERGAHHRKWERVDKIIRPDGEEEEVVRGYTELASGLNYWDEDAADWIESRAIVEPFEGGAVARQGQNKVIFSPTLGDPNGTVDILSDDGQRFRSVVLGLSYYDPISGDDVILSEVNPDVVGQIIPPNQVIYPNAFKDIQADLVYEYRRSGFSQNVVLHEQPPDPALIGFSDSTRLEVLSEFLESPEPVKRPRIIRPIVDTPAARQAAAQADLVDETLEFGSVRIGDGSAFDIDQGPEVGGSIVVKNWSTIGGRQILFEGVEYSSAKASLQELPPADRLLNGNQALLDRVRQEARSIPSRQVAKQNLPHPSEIQIASADRTRLSGYLIDYEFLSGSFSGYTFKTGETYYLNDRTYFYGTTTFEGGAVIKHDSSTLELLGSIDFRSTPYHPTVFTAKNDDSVGETIVGSTGVPPSSPYDSSALKLKTITNQTVRNVRISYAQIGINCSYGSGHRLEHIQLINCYVPIFSYGCQNLYVGNALIENFYYGLQNYPMSPPGSILGENLTLADGDYSVQGSGIELKNTLIVEADNNPTYTGQGALHNIQLPSATGVFQTAGGGHFYLVNNSPYRDLGTSSIDPDLADELKERTTYPPSVFDGPLVYTSDLHWTAHVPRDNDGSLDLGYHYPALDYLVYSVTLDQNANLTVDAGTQFGLYGHWFVKLGDDAKASFNGSASAPVNIAWYGDVQESVDPSRISGSSHIHFYGYDSLPGANQNQLNLDYTFVYRGSYPTSEKYGIYVNNATHGLFEVNVRHSFFDGMTFQLTDVPGRTHRIFNCEFQAGKILIGGQSSSTGAGQGIDFRNNLVYGSVFRTNQDIGADLWVIRDNLFHEFDIGNPITLNNSQLDYNGYVNTSERVGASTQPNDVVLSILAYESGPFGEYYQPGTSPLIDAGSQLADAAGLMHHTVLATGPPEGTATSMTTVDIGLHYPAVDTGTGELLDEDGDGLANVVEDINGNGLHDSGESHWQTVTSGLQVFTTLDQ